MIKMLNAIFGLPNKAMGIQQSVAGLYDMVGKVFNSMIYCVDDLKPGDKGGHFSNLDDCVKGLYDGMLRVVYKKQRRNRCLVVLTMNDMIVPMISLPNHVCLRKR